MELMNPIRVLCCTIDTLATVQDPKSQNLVMQYVGCMLKNPDAFRESMDTKELCNLLSHLADIYESQVNQLEEAQSLGSPPKILIPDALANIQGVLVDLNRDIQQPNLDVLLEDVLRVAMNNYDGVEDMKQHILALDAFHGIIHGCYH